MIEHAPWLQHVLSLAQPYIERYGYLAVFGGVMIESFGIPAPGQSLLIVGALAASRGEMHIVALLFTAWSAAIIGDNIGYAIGRYAGRRLILHHGRHAGARMAYLERVERFFERYGGWIVVVARFFDVLRQLNGIVAGTSGISWWRFLAFNVLGATLWVGLWGMGAYYLGHHIEPALALFKHFEPYIIGAGLLAITLAVFYVFKRRF